MRARIEQGERRGVSPPWFLRRTAGSLLLGDRNFHCDPLWEADRKATGK